MSNNTTASTGYLGAPEVNFFLLCPDVTSIDEWCLSPPSNGTCCGICPNTISGVESHIALAFSSLATIAAIALDPSSAPSALFTNLLTCNAYAISLLGFLLSSDSGLDLFHAGFTLLIALSSLIPLAAVAASPEWAVTGEEDPAKVEARQKSQITTILKRLEDGQREARDAAYQAAMEGSDSSEDSSESEGERSARRRRRARAFKTREREERRLMKKYKRRPAILITHRNPVRYCGLSRSHWVLFIGFGGSLVLWWACYKIGLVGAMDGRNTALIQTNCSDSLGGAQALIDANFWFLILAVVVFVATVANPLLHDCIRARGRPVTFRKRSSHKAVFAIAFVVWLVWMAVSWWLYWLAASTNVLAAEEFSWSFGSTYALIMVLVPIVSIAQAMLGLVK